MLNCPSTIVDLSVSFCSSIYFCFIYFNLLQLDVCVLTSLVMSSSLCPHGRQPARLLCPWGLSRQEYQSGLPYSPPGALPNPGIEPRSPTLQADSLPSEPPGKPHLGANTLTIVIASWRTDPFIVMKYSLISLILFSYSRIYLILMQQLQFSPSTPSFF